MSEREGTGVGNHCFESHHTGSSELQTPIYKYTHLYVCGYTVSSDSPPCVAAYCWLSCSLEHGAEPVRQLRLSFPHLAVGNVTGSHHVGQAKTQLQLLQKLCENLYIPD